MLTKFGMKIYLTLKESRGGGNKWGERDDRREGKWEKEVTRSKHFWEQTRSNERIGKKGGRQSRMEDNTVSLTQHDYYGSLLQNYTYITCIELLAFSVGMDREGGRKGGREVGIQSITN